MEAAQKVSSLFVRREKTSRVADDYRGLLHGFCGDHRLFADSRTQKLGAELAVTQTESGEHIYTFKTAQPVPVVAWAPTRYFLAYAELGSLRIVGVDTERKY